ncbi:MAG: Hexuronate transporter [Acidobacteriaceae bacterium]|nr:Hexuronate transporter [Acidobacteriaceae bacterium]
MLFAATSINYMDRQVLSILAPTLQHSIGWTEQQYGYIVSAFQFAYALGLIVAGRMVDKLGTRLGYALVMAVWSAAAMAHSLVRSTFGFGLARFFLGLGESGNFPAAVKSTAEWFPQRERSLATGIFNSGANLGAIVAPATIPWITLHYGWRPAFLATGTFSLTWIGWWLWKYRRPREDARVSAAELAWIEADESPSVAKDLEAAPQTTTSWSKLLRYRQTWGFAVAKFLTDPIWYFYLFWMPKFLDARFHLGLAHLGLPLIVVYYMSAAVCIGGGYLPSLLSTEGVSIQRARLRAMLLCACLAVPVFYAGHTIHAWVAVILLGIATAAHQGWSANLFTTASDMFPKRTVGAVVGLGSAAGSAGGVLFAATIGRILQVTGSYAILFAIAASSYLLGLLFLTRLAPGLRRAEIA